MMQVPQVTPIPRFVYVPKFQPAQTFTKMNNMPFTPNRPQYQQQGSQQAIEFDGKRLRKAVTRKTVDYNTSVINYLESRVWQRDYRDRRVAQPDPAYYTEMTPPLSMPDNPINAVTTKFVRTSTNKMRCPIFCVAWTPEGRRLVTGASSGEFTLWNGLTFNFETILQAHDSPVRCMVWSHNDVWMVTGDHAGYVKYWQSNMNNVKMFQAHKEPLRAISFCPVDTKFVTCSDDGTVRIWDFLRCFEEKILRGHGADVKCVDWHPQKSLIVSGSKDSQQPIKLWDPKTGQSLATVHAHKNTVMDAKWNKNGNWLLTASRDHLIKLFDIRNMSQEMQTFRGHKKEATTLAWHPVHEGLFTSGGSDGCVMFWVVGADKEVGCMEQAHDSCVWSLAWHPLGHILCSGSNDHSSKFWTRNRPGDRMQDKYNLNTLPKGLDELADYDDTGAISSIPGMGLEYGLPDHLKPKVENFEEEATMIPGLDFTSEDSALEKSTTHKKIPFSKPIPKQFQQQWMESKQPLLLAPPQDNERSNGEVQRPPNMDIKPPPMMPPPGLPFPPNQAGPPPPPFPDQQHRLPPRSVLLGERPQEMPPMQPPPQPDLHQMNRPIKQEHHQMNRPPMPQDHHQMNMPPMPQDHHQMRPPMPQEHHQMNRLPMPQEHHQMRPPMPQDHQMNRPPITQEHHQMNRPPMPYAENHHENYPQEVPRNQPHETWRTYSNESGNMNRPPNMNENGGHRQNPSFDPSSNSIGPPPQKRGRQDMFLNPPTEEDGFAPENIPPMGPPFGGGDGGMRFGSDGMDQRNNSHRGPPSESEDWSHKRSWPENSSEEQFRDYDGPPNFNPRHSNRSSDSSMFHRGGRGPRAPFRGGRSPFRVNNRGRGRGGYQS